LAGYKFRRQYPLGSYVVDFLCIEQRVIVEVDGGQHVDQAKYDIRRTNYLHRIGFTILRYWDDDALLRTEAVLENILMHMPTTGRASPHPDPLPASGAREGSSDPSQ
jgi:very-short-patch-repair endonuclease